MASRAFFGYGIALPRGVDEKWTLVLYTNVEVDQWRGFDNAHYTSGTRNVQLTPDSPGFSQVRQAFHITNLRPDGKGNGHNSDVEIRGNMERNMVSDVAQVYKLWNEYAAAANDEDMERWLALWSDDGIQMPPGVPRRVGKEQIRREMQPLFDLFDTSKMIIHTEEVRILGDRAYSHGTYECEMTPKEGGETKSYSGKFLDVLEKQVDGSWKIAIDCHNYNMPSE